MDKLQFLVLIIEYSLRERADRRPTCATGTAQNPNSNTMQMLARPVASGWIEIQVC